MEVEALLVPVEVRASLAIIFLAMGTLIGAIARRGDSAIITFIGAIASGGGCGADVPAVEAPLPFGGVGDCKATVVGAGRGTDAFMERVVVCAACCCGFSGCLLLIGAQACSIALPP